MIASLTGTIESTHVNRLVLYVNGVGYLVHVTPVFASQSHVGAQTTLHTTQIVREDSISLYGFADATARDFFEVLLTVSGVGPKVALSMLSSFTPSEIASAITSEKTQTLEKIPGIGKKVASRLILELKDKVKSSPSKTKNEAWSEQLLTALTGLGYKSKDAEVAIERVRKTLKNNVAERDLSELLKMALTSASE
jgi:Holliday junction DNA helicase RuvA